MSRDKYHSINMYQQHQAVQACERGLEQLRIEIVAGPRRVVDAFIEQISCLIEHTGGTLETSRLRSELAECQRMIAARQGRALARNRKLRLVNSSGGVA